MTKATARVYVNDVEVGALPADQYRRVVADVRRNRWLYVAQLGNLLWALWSFIVMALRMMPIVFFMPLLAMTLLAPEMVTAMIATIRSATPEEITYSVRSYLSITFLLTLFSMFFTVIFTGVRFGYIDQFNLQVSQRLRSLLEVPAEGNVMVVVTEDGPNDDK